MPDTRGASHDCAPRRENVCIDSYRILDSCKDKDCFEDTKLMLTDYAQEVIDKSSSVRVAATEILWSDISVSPVRFNKGFYQISIRFYTKVLLEACVALGKVQEVEGIAVNDKCVVLYGGEGSVKSFKSGSIDDFCMCKNDEMKSEGKPTVVVDVVDPIALSVKVTEQKLMNACCCCCCCDELPSKVVNCLNGSLSSENGGKNVYVSLGFFSVIRMERPTQLILSASEYCVPDKVCSKCAAEDDPCAVFAKMSFPVNEFCACPVSEKKC